MKKYITFIIAAVLVLGASAAQADHHSKPKKEATAKKKAAPDKAKAAEARKKYAAAVKKIREAVKAGKLTEAQAKKKYAELRSKMAPNRQGLLKRFDKNKDGKLCDNEKAAMRKAMEARKKQQRGKGKKRRRPSKK